MLEDDIVCDFNGVNTKEAFKFTGDDITLDCNGYTISAIAGTATSGVSLEGQRVVSLVAHPAENFVQCPSFFLLVDCSSLLCMTSECFQLRNHWF